MPLITVHTTVADERDAQAIATAAVQQGLAACVHEERITSTYRWKGEVHREAEIRLSLKTTDERVAALERLILELHPYELPAVWAVPVVRASEDYAAWVAGQVGGQVGGAG